MKLNGYKEIDRLEWKYLPKDEGAFIFTESNRQSYYFKKLDRRLIND